MERKIKPLTVLAIGGIILAIAFVVTAIVSPGSLDRVLHPADERNSRIKDEMERQKRSDPNGQSDDNLKRGEKTKSAGITPTPSPDETAQPEEPGKEDARRDERIPMPVCITRDQVIRTISASEEAREGRVIGINITSDGGRIMILYRKKTFLGIGSGENQIEGILRRGLRNSFSDRLIKSVKVRSTGTRSVRRGAKNFNAEFLEIESLQAGCQWP